MIKALILDQTFNRSVQVEPLTTRTLVQKRCYDGHIRFIFGEKKYFFWSVLKRTDCI